MRERVVQVEVFAPRTELEAGGFVVSDWLDISYTDGQISLVLENAGSSTDLTVTYELGYIKSEDEDTGTITPIPPEDGGVVPGLSNVNIPAGSKHASTSVPPARYYRFTCTNNDVANSALIALYAFFQKG